MLNTLFIERAGGWFLHSGIQEPDGGVARFYRVDTGGNARVSTEITGYAVSAFVLLFRLTGEAAYLAAAVRAGRFLLQRAWDARLSIFPFEWSNNGHLPEPYAYFFDSGIICRGLLALYRATGDRAWLEGAVAGGRSMVRDFLAAADGVGAIPPILVLPEKRPLAFEPRWSREPGCYQLKSAMAWLDLDRETGGNEFGRYYDVVLAASLRTHLQFLEAAATREGVMDRLHAYCYFLEALLVSYGIPEVRLALADGIAAAARHLRELEPLFVRSDVYAQLLRVRLYADALGVVALDREAAAQEAAAAAAFQVDSADRRQHGGFCFGRKGSRSLPFVNPVSTAFCLQALSNWEQRLSGGSPAADIADLV
ncbi:MAG: hypothetical protein ACK5AZ_17085 [Bryobacteraceae bacterium]